MYHPKRGIQGAPCQDGILRPLYRPQQKTEITFFFANKSFPAGMTQKLKGVFKNNEVIALVYSSRMVFFRIFLVCFFFIRKFFSAWHGVNIRKKSKKVISHSP